MALFTPSESPAVVVKEVDLTSGVPNVQSTTGAYVGNFRWGPAEQATLVSSEATLAETFATPGSDEVVDFLSVTQFLRYSNNLQVVRAISSSAYNATASGSPTVVRNQDHWDSIKTSFGADSGDVQAGAFIAKYPGALGNSIKVSICPAGSDSGGTFFSQWTYKSAFDGAPATSSYASNRSGANDEVHVAVIDEDGAITGTIGSILETFPFISLASDAKLGDGTSNYMYDVINNRSRFIWVASFEGNTAADLDELSNAGLAAQGTTYSASATDNVEISLSAGADCGTLGVSEITNGFDLFSDVDTITVDFLICPSMASRTDQTSVVNHVTAITTQTRKDSVAVASPARTDIIGNASPTASAVLTCDTYTNSSYLVVDNNFLKVYDKFNDQYLFVPAASSTAGIMAATDANAAPWFSPAGQRRGQYLGIIALAYSPTKQERDTLYKAGINPVANIPGQGVLLFGDKTKLNRPSAFDRINVRRLFLVLERAIGEAAKNVMFEFNDEFTRAEFVNIVEPVLREVKGRRGITDFKCVCDETNNTDAVVDRNEFIANIFIKPARSINYVTLNFVAVRSGVDFEEVVGTV